MAWIKIQENNAEFFCIAAVGIAVGLMGQKKYNEAKKELHAAIDCSPSLAEAYVQLGGICLQRGDKDGCFEYNKQATKAMAGQQFSLWDIL